MSQYELTCGQRLKSPRIVHTLRINTAAASFLGTRDIYDFCKAGTFVPSPYHLSARDFLFRPSWSTLDLHSLSHSLLLDYFQVSKTRDLGDNMAASWFMGTTNPSLPHACARVGM
jgi:hypothetical protein